MNSIFDVRFCGLLQTHCVWYHAIVQIIFVRISRYPAEETDGITAKKVADTLFTECTTGNTTAVALIML